jgi:hypothetical protein
MRLYPQGLALRVQADGAGQPLSFVWAGDLHRVTSIEDVREPRLDWWAATGEVHRVYYLVITHQGLICELYRDVARGGWFLSRVFD